MRRLAVLLPLLLPPAALVATAAAACTITQETAVELTDAGPLRVVPVMVDGKPARFLLDTGAEKTVLTPTGRLALGLPDDAWTSTGVRGVGGVEVHPDAVVGAIAVGTVALTRRLGPIRSVPVLGPASTLAGPYGLDGALGDDLLAGHDIELLKRGRLLRLHRTEGCSGAFLSWAAATVPLEFPRPFHPVVPVTVGGVELRALLDTGAQSSMITRRAAGIRGVPVPGAVTGAKGIGPATLIVEARDFGPVIIGGLRLADGPLYVAALPATGWDVLLGMDRLSTWRIWLSYATSQVMIGPDMSGP